jgi:hypothetical protein
MNYDIKTEEGMANSVAWTENLFKTLADGATWMIPRSMTIVKVYPLKREVEVTRGHTLDASIEKVIKAMGWTVTIT